MTPSELLIDALSNENIDEIEECIVLFRRCDGTVGNRGAKLSGEHTFYDAISLLNFVRLSLEHDLRKQWNQED